MDSESRVSEQRNRLVVAALVGACVLTGVYMVTDAAVSGSQQPVSAVHAYESQAQVRQRVDEIVRTLPREAQAGVVADEETGGLRVQVTAAGAVMARERLADVDGVEVVVVDHSLTDLETAKAAVESQADSLLSRGVRVAAVWSDVKGNSVGVRLYGKEVEQGRAMVQKIVGDVPVILQTSQG
ncbi:Uncharacterised protein [Dermatophilus congolensis]|uniref:Uncharacterized protein n=1 Tax=Dermatophilus congolensis TaxID=1863 RepID=A0AA46BNW4_9MICO|nr:hypothetical protein [Dermatophilus congolensis]STD11446.1 Uncharacterised protein [Dermatophilus congolensis]